MVRSESCEEKFNNESVSEAALSHLLSACMWLYELARKDQFVTSMALQTDLINMMCQ